MHRSMRSRTASTRFRCSVSTAAVTLRRGPDAQIAQGHPWIFKRAIDSQKGSREAGTIVDVLTSDRTWVGRGIFNPHTDLSIRIFTRRDSEAIDKELILARVDASLDLRDALEVSDPSMEDTDSCRLIYSEADLLSGLIVDRYADALAIQLRAKAIEPFLPAIIARLKERTGAEKVFIEVSQDHAQREKIDLEFVASLSGESGGPIQLRESGFTYEADLRKGQKTGFYLDQRINRARVGSYAQDRRVLSCHCYTGAFELHAARNGAKDILASTRPSPRSTRRRDIMSSTRQLFLCATRKVMRIRNSGATKRAVQRSI